MTLLHDAYTALLSGLTHRTGNEIHWHDGDGCPITVEPIDVDSDSYIVRRYRESGSLNSEVHYCHNQRHGKDTVRHKNGQLMWEKNYHRGQIHGKSVCWNPNGQKNWEEDWYKGKRHGKHMWWNNDGSLFEEKYYIYDCQVIPEEWKQHNEPTA